MAYAADTDLTPGQHVATYAHAFVAILGVVPAGSGPAAPPGGGSGSGISTRPASGQLWPRGDGVPRN